MTIRWTMTRKMSMTPEMRKKYQEKVSNPPPAGRGPNPVEIRDMNGFLPIGMIVCAFFRKCLMACTGNGDVNKPGEHRSHHKISGGDEQSNGKDHNDGEQHFLGLHSFAPEVN